MTKNLNTLTRTILVSLFLTGCASGYHAINANSMNFHSKSGDSTILVEYQTNLLKHNYAAREIRSGVNLIAVKITNSTNREIIPKKNIKIFSGGNELTMISLNNFYDATRQDPNKSLRFLFLLPLNVYTFSQTTSGSEITSQKNRFYPIGLIIGPALAFGNQAAAKSANRKFKEELDQNNIMEKIIRPGETISGLIAINEKTSNDLIFKTTF